MANRRMFSKDIVTTRAFLEMPSSSRALYYQLGVEADDDGFIDPYITMLATKSQDDDLKILLAKGFVISFKSGVCVIRHWNQNNSIRKDRYTPTQYKEEFRLLSDGENGEYLLTDGVQPVVNQVSTDGSHSIDKVSIDKVSIDKDNNTLKETNVPETVNTLIKLFEPVNPSYKTLFANKTQRGALDRLVKEHGYHKVEDMLKSLPQVTVRPYAPRITNPLQLESKLGELVVFISQEKNKGGGVYDATTG